MNKQQTAVEWLIDELMPSIALQTKYIDELKEQAKEMETRDYALFLRWILKHYSTKTTDDGFVGYVDSMDRDVDIETIIQHYKSSEGLG